MDETEIKYRSLLEKLVFKTIDLFEKEIPLDLMKTPKGASLMYNITINLLIKLAFAMEIKKHQVIEDIEKIFNFFSIYIEDKEKKWN